MRGLRVAFGLLLAASVGVLAWRACGGLRVETDLTSLVSAENLPALRDVSADRTRQGRFVINVPHGVEQLFDLLARLSPYDPKSRITSA